MPNDELMQKYLPDLAAEKQRLGSARNDNFLLDLVLKMTDAAFGSPGEAKVGGILGPIGRSGIKGIDQAQKKVVKSLFKGDPQTLKEVVASPRPLNIQVPGVGGKRTPQSTSLLNDVMENAFALFQGAPNPAFGGSIRVHPDVMRGKFPTGNARSGPMVKQGVEGLPDIITHEARHFQTTPAIDKLFEAATGPRGEIPAKQLADALYPFIGHAKFGQKMVANRAMVSPQSAVDEAISYLAQPSGRSPAASWLNQAVMNRPREGGIGQFDEKTQKLLQEALLALQDVFPQGVK